MASSAKTFSESWYRIAGQRVALRPHVQIHRQFFRGERCHVLHDPFNNQFFRLRAAAYEFVARLRMDRTVEDAWQQCMAANPDEAPGQEDALRLLAQLYGSNLLHSNLPPDSEKLFERYRTRKLRETRQTLLNLMNAKFPIFDPDPWLKAMLPVLRRVISPLGAIVWLAVIVMGLKAVADHGSRVFDQSQGLLAPGNALFLYCGMLLVKAVHEFGHASVCRRFGGEVHVLGLMLIIFTPMPYVDTTSAYAFRSRWQRAFVGAAGMTAELFVAALAALVWARTAPGAVNSIAYNMMVVASVSTVIFNINPLLRFDGYYIVSDLVEIPNLQIRAVQQVTYLAERWLFGCREVHDPSNSRREGIGLAAFGIASGIYRVFLFGAILLFIADRFLIVGLIMALICAVAWLVLPLGKLVHYLASSPRLVRHRGRAVAVCAAAAVVLIGALAWLPMPSYFRAPGVVEAVEHSMLSADVGGQLEQLLVPSGNSVKRGDPLMRLENPELLLEIRGAAAQLAAARARREQAMEESVADLQTIDSQIEAIEKHRKRLADQEKSLVVRAPHDGLWLAPNLDQFQHAWIPRGTELGLLVNPASFRFSAVVSEEETSRLFGGEIRKGEVRLAGQSAIPVPVLTHQIIPAEQQLLPSAALGWSGGGEVALAKEDRAGTKTKDPFFALRATLASGTAADLLEGRSGTIRCELPAEPLLAQWLRKLRQLLQKRYSL